MSIDILSPTLCFLLYGSGFLLAQIYITLISQIIANLIGVGLDALKILHNMSTGPISIDFFAWFIKILSSHKVRVHAREVRLGSWAVGGWLNWSSLIYGVLGDIYMSLENRDTRILDRAPAGWNGQPVLDTAG